MSKITASSKSLYSHIRSALRGEEHDYTAGSINKAIFLLAVPMIAEMVMESTFALVDMIFVSRLGVEAVAVVGLTEPVMMIIYSMAMGLGMAITAIVARRIGEKDPKQASDAAFQAIVIAVLLAIPLGFLGYAYSGNILRFMGATESVISQGSGFTQVMFAGNLSIFLLFLINAIFRGAGNPAIAMRSLFLSNGLNIILDPIFIFGLGPIPAMGVEGAAIATVIGRSCGVLYQLYHLLDGSGIIHLTKENVVMRFQTVREILVVAASGAGQFLIESASWIFLAQVIARFGETAVAGYTLAFRVIVFTLLPSFGIANAAATLVGQNLGAKQPERAETSVWKAALYNTFFLFGVSVVFFVFADPILRLLFNAKEAELVVGRSALQIICLGYIFFSYGMVIGQAFNGAGDTFTPMMISLVVFWGIQIPLAYGLAIYLDWKSNGVFASIAICHSLYAIAAIKLFKRGKWKLTKV
ncbi:MAG TPA: MATE family efflux transporter [Bacteroidetes bacterium]|nr:MATE family efflux transporter [Bacteroidota bacterium]